jgi:hypothetical protein
MLRGDQYCKLMVLLAIPLGLLPGCNEHPLSPLEQVITTTYRQSNILPPKTKVDFLFVIDSSGSMAEEQQNLRENFSAFSHFLFDELGAAANYRIAITNMDSQSDGASGQFLIGSNNNARSGGIFDFNGCAELSQAGELKSILRAEDVRSKEDLERKFGCMAALGIQGSGIESGLESMRKALSCNGPNAGQFGHCCIPDPSQEGPGRLIYNPSCDPVTDNMPEPEFLRPDALLVVVIISDENDCSMPVLNQMESKRPICGQDMNQMPADFVPVGYQNSALCGGLSAQQCYRRDCGGLTPHDCYAARCDPVLDAESSCEWNQQALTQVDDYIRFLESLKANPGEQVVVATIVGQQAYTPLGKPIDYSPVVGPLNPLCIPFGEPIPLNYEFVQSDECCPEGHCQGERVISCFSLGNGIAFSGTRYLEMAEAFGGNSISCKALSAETVHQTQLDACEDRGRDQDCQWMEQGPSVTGKCRPIVDSGVLACSQCTSICEDSFQKSLQQIKNRVSELLGTHCLERLPACMVAELGEKRHCDTPEEYQNLVNYLSSIQVSTRCQNTAVEGGHCEIYEADQLLDSSAWSLELSSDVCGGGSLVRLRNLPRVGSEIVIEYYTQIRVR